MSDTETQYADFILNKYFGEAATIVTRLMRVKGACTLSEVLQNCKSLLNPRRITRCLKTLIQHSVVVITQQPNLKYLLNYERIFYLPRLPLFCKLVFHFYGKVSEEIILYLSLMGRARLCNLLSFCLNEHSKTNNSSGQHEYIELLSNSINTLIKTNVLQIVNPKSWMDNTIETGTCTESGDGLNTSYVQSVIPLSNDVLSKLLHDYVNNGCSVWPGELDTNEPVRKRLKQLEDNLEVNNYLEFVICPNIQTLETMWRDRLICQFSSENLGEDCGDLLSHLLCIATAASRSTGIRSTESGVVSRSELMRSMRTVPEYFSSFITLMKDNETKFLLQQPGLGGHMYSCSYKHVITQLFIKQIEYIIQLLFGNNGSRIFRLLLLSGPMNIEEIERKVLLAQNDFRRLLPRMVTMGLIATTELSRTKDFSAETIYCLYSVNLEHIARFLIELSQHSALRIGLSRNNAFDEKRSLIEQRYRVEILIQQYQTKLTQINEDNNVGHEISSKQNGDSPMSSETEHRESVQALKSSITPIELGQLSSLIKKLSKLVGCELECHVAWFVADMYLRLHS